MEFRRDWYSVSHSRDRDLESVLSVKLPQRRFVLYRMQTSFNREEVDNAAAEYKKEYGEEHIKDEEGTYYTCDFFYDTLEKRDTMIEAF